MLSIIIPTISGREESLARTCEAYERAGYGDELVIVKDLPNWPAACNEGARRARGDVLHFGSDDVEPTPNWYRFAPEVLAANEIPAPLMWDHSLAGQPVNVDGDLGQTCPFSRVPTLTRRQHDLIGPWPEIDYYADCWLGEAAATLGIPCRVTADYYFVHHWNQVGRLDTEERLAIAQAAYDTLRGGR